MAGSKRKMAEVEQQYEENLRELRQMLEVKNEELRTKNLAFDSLEVTFEKKRFESVELEMRLAKLEEKNKAYQAAHLRLLGEKVAMEGEV